jgi:Ni/Fe-hydrogenase subunit HybB-like protein
VILTAFAAVLGLHLLASFFGAGPPRILAVAAIVAAVPAATYTAWLFAQAKARDLWQSPLLPPLHLVAAVAAGSAALFIAARMFSSAAAPVLGAIAAIATVVHLFLIAAEVLMPHATAHARLASREMVSGRFRAAFRAGVILQLAGAAAIALGLGGAAAVLVLAGLLLYERSHIGAGQAVPLA